MHAHAYPHRHDGKQSCLKCHCLEMTFILHALQFKCLNENLRDNHTGATHLAFTNKICISVITETSLTGGGTL